MGADIDYNISVVKLYRAVELWRQVKAMSPLGDIARNKIDYNISVVKRYRET